MLVREYSASQKYLGLGLLRDRTLQRSRLPGSSDMALNRFICCYRACFEFLLSYIKDRVWIRLIPRGFTLHKEYFSVWEGTNCPVLFLPVRKWYQSPSSCEVKRQRHPRTGQLCQETQHLR